MVIKDIDFKLKDGRDAFLRSAKESDSEELLDYLRITSGETLFVMRYPEECSKYTIADETALIAQWNESPNDAMILCTVDGKLAGNCHIVFSSGIKTRHRATVMIALFREYWNLGIGTRMFQEMISLAEERKEVRQLELSFVEGNSRARALYEKMGFRVAGIHPDALMLKDGTLLNEYLMIRLIDDRHKL
jgi:RimJ/RimL family protein N-acetyltransferase